MANKTNKSAPTISAKKAYEKYLQKLNNDLYLIANKTHKSLKFFPKNFQIAQDGSTAQVELHVDSDFNLGELCNFHDMFVKTFFEYGISFTTDIHTTKFSAYGYYDYCEHKLFTIITFVSWDKLEELKRLYAAKTLEEKAEKRENNKKRRLAAAEAKKAKDIEERNLYETLKKKYEN